MRAFFGPKPFRAVVEVGPDDEAEEDELLVGDPELGEELGPVSTICAAPVDPLLGARAASPRTNRGAPKRRLS